MEPTRAHRIDRVIRYVQQECWAIEPRYFVSLRDILVRRAAGVMLSDEEIAAEINAAGGPRGPATVSQPGVAVIPVWGVIGHRMNELRDISSSVGTSTEMLGAQIAQMADDPNVSAIVLDINSPGGGVFGVQEVADQIRSARSKKPIIGVANALAASAAYWIASATSELVITPSGQIGAIGVYSIHEDHAKELADLGVNVTVVKAGKHKFDNNPFGPLSDEARQAIQDKVDAYYALFTKGVAKGRGVSIDAVRGGFGEGRVVNASEAVKLGMADRVATMNDVIGELVAGRDLEALSAAADARFAAFVDESGAPQAEIAADSAAIAAVAADVPVAADPANDTQEERDRRYRLRRLQLEA